MRPMRALMHDQLAPIRAAQRGAALPTRRPDRATGNRAVALCAAVLCAALVAPAAHAVSLRASACDTWRHPGLFEGPATVGFYPAELGSGRRACPRTELGLYVRGGAIIDTPGFYGNLGAAGVLFGSFALSRRLELFGALEFVDFQFAQNASLKGTSLNLGQLSVGASVVGYDLHHVVLSPYGRLVLPTSSATSRVRDIGAEIGLALSYRPLDRVEVHGVVGWDLSAGLGNGPADVRAGVLLNAGVQYNPATWFGLLIDVNAHLAQRAVLDYLAPVLGLRFRLYRNLGAELGASLPLAGADRRLFLGDLKFAYRF